MYKNVYDNMIMLVEVHEEFNVYPHHLVENHIDFWSCWMLRNSNTQVHEDEKIVPIVVSKAMVDALELSMNLFHGLEDVDVSVRVLSSLDVIDKYLWGHPSLFEKCLIFFTSLVTPDGYIGLVAVNPWVHLVQYAKETDKEFPLEAESDGPHGVNQFVSGLIYNHASDGTAPLTDALPFLIFLNMASCYHNLRLHLKHLLFNYFEMVKIGTPVAHLLLLGLEGPFGHLHKIESDEEMVF
jgi:hypothetical protein